MENYIKEAEKQKRALETIKRLKKKEEDQAVLTAAIDALKAKADKGDLDFPSPMRRKAAKYTQILDGLFDHYLEKSKDLETHDLAFAMLLKTHQQAIRSMHLWQKLHD